MYIASAMKHAPTVRSAVRSTCSRRVTTEPPYHRSSRRHFDQTIQPEPNQQDGASNQPSTDGDHAFEAVVADGEVFQPPTAPYVLFTTCRTRRRHVSVMRDHGRSSRRTGPLHCGTPDKVARHSAGKLTQSPTQPEFWKHATASPHAVSVVQERPRQFHIHLIPHPNFIPKSTARHHPLRALHNCGHHTISAAPWRPRLRPPQVLSVQAISAFTSFDLTRYVQRKGSKF
jgi:hypothetical protein